MERNNRAAYFSRFENVWCHGDFAEWTAHGGLIIHGRSDATLNPGGVRIGTAEIYNQVETIDEVLEALCIGQDWDGDVRVVLFVRLKEGVALVMPSLHGSRIVSERALRRAMFRRRSLPLPISREPNPVRSLKLAVRDIVHGRPVKNKEALANPEALSHFENIAVLQN